jgi:hypothetical protein
MTLALTEAGAGQRPPALSGLQLCSRKSLPWRVLPIFGFIA